MEGALNEQTFKNKMGTNQNQKDINFSVDGIHCIQCIRKIQTLSKDFQDIKSVKVDLGTKRISLKVEDSFDALSYELKVRNEGFHIRQINRDEDFKVSGHKKFLIQIGVAGFCTGNIMLLAAAEYVGATEESWAKIFPFLSALLFLPVMFYSAQPFFLNSFYAFRARRISIDTPLALAIFGGAFLSYWQLFTGQHGVYFDSLSMFVFFLLSSRYLVYKTQNKYLSPVKVEDVYSLKTVSVLEVDQQSNTAGLTLEDLYSLRETQKLIKKSTLVDHVKVGDIVEVPKNGFVPLDGELFSEYALVSDAFFSGEFMPKEKSKHDVLFAGSKNLSGSFLLKVKKNLKETRLSEIVEKLNQSLNERTDISSLSDKGANYLTLTIVAISIVTLGYFYFVDFNEGLSRVLALLVVACPCGLAIAVPLLQSLALKKGLKKSLLIKKPSVLESLPQVHAVIFDKTGTLTSGEIKVLKSSPRPPTEKEKQILYHLEKHSEHPIALAIIKWVGEQKNIPLKDFKEHLGKGVSGYLDSDHYEIKSSQSQSLPAVEFFKSGELQFTIYLNDSVAFESKDVVKDLHQKNLNTYVLSGDQKIYAMQLAEELEIDSKNVFAPLSPEEKADFIKAFKVNALYIGDGVNDSIAMSHSLVSVSMESSANVAFKSSDVHILSGGLNGILELYKLSARYLKSIKYTITLSIIYNLIFAGFALLGFINPLIAVILMPISSISITFLAIFLMSREESQSSIDAFKSDYPELKTAESIGTL